MAVILDTGPLVALLDGRDSWHDWAREQFARIEPPLMTCEPVLTEAAHLLARAGLGPPTITSLLRRGLFEVPFRIDEHSSSIAKLLLKYADVPISLADACLVRMSELLDDSTVLTLDSDFTVYRRHGRQQIPLIYPR